MSRPTTGQGTIAIEVHERQAPAIPEIINEALTLVRDGERPDAWLGMSTMRSLTILLTQVRCAREVACGMFYRWTFPGANVVRRSIRGSRHAVDGTLKYAHKFFRARSIWIHRTSARSLQSAIGVTFQQKRHARAGPRRDGRHGAMSAIQCNQRQRRAACTLI